MAVTRMFPDLNRRVSRSSCRGDFITELPMTGCRSGRDYVARLKKARANVGARKEVSPRGMAAHTGIIRATQPSEALPTSASSWLGRP